MAGLQLLDPTGINLVYADRDVQKAALRREGWVLDGDWDLARAQSFEQLDTFRALRDRFVLGRRWQDTDYYRSRVALIEQGVPKWGCSTEAEFLERLQRRVEGLYDDICEDGYRTQEELGSDDLWDEIQVGIRRDGQLLFMGVGRHRLSIARLLGLAEVPARIVVLHRAWTGSESELPGRPAADGRRTG